MAYFEASAAALLPITVLLQTVCRWIFRHFDMDQLSVTCYPDRCLVFECDREWEPMCYLWHFTKLGFIIMITLMPLYLWYLSKATDKAMVDSATQSDGPSLRIRLPLAEINEYLALHAHQHSASPTVYRTALLHPNRSTAKHRRASHAVKSANFSHIQTDTVSNHARSKTRQAREEAELSDIAANPVSNRTRSKTLPARESIVLSNGDSGPISSRTTSKTIRILETKKTVGICAEIQQNDPNSALVTSRTRSKTIGICAETEQNEQNNANSKPVSSRTRSKTVAICAESEKKDADSMPVSSRTRPQTARIRAESEQSDADSGPVSSRTRSQTRENVHTAG